MAGTSRLFLVDTFAILEHICRRSPLQVSRQNHVRHIRQPILANPCPRLGVRIAAGHVISFHGIPVGIVPGQARIDYQFATKPRRSTLAHAVIHIALVRILAREILKVRMCHREIANDQVEHDVASLGCLYDGLRTAERRASILGVLASAGGTWTAEIALRFLRVVVARHKQGGHSKEGKSTKDEFVERTHAANLEI